MRSTQPKEKNKHDGTFCRLGKGGVGFWAAVWIGLGLGLGFGPIGTPTLRLPGRPPVSTRERGPEGIDGSGSGAKPRSDC